MSNLEKDLLKPLYPPWNAVYINCTNIYYYANDLLCDGPVLGFAIQGWPWWYYRPCSQRTVQERDLSWQLYSSYPIVCISCCWCTGDRQECTVVALRGKECVRCLQSNPGCQSHGCSFYWLDWLTAKFIPVWVVNHFSSVPLTPGLLMMVISIWTIQSQTVILASYAFLREN